MHVKRAAAVFASAALATTLLGAVPALANPITGQNAITQLSLRPDSGGNGDWAIDTISRDLNIQLIGHTLTGWEYQATVTDLGSFRTIADAYTPNQHFPWHNARLFSVVTGRLGGKATYEFTASQPADMVDVPATEVGAPVTAAQTTSDWYEQAFPAGTLFSGPGIASWAWTYHGPSCGPFGTQEWVDAGYNNGGQTITAGNITGFCL